MNPSSYRTGQCIPLRLSRDMSRYPGFEKDFSELGPAGRQALIDGVLPPAALEMPKTGALADPCAEAARTGYL